MRRMARHGRSTGQLLRVLVGLGIAVTCGVMLLMPANVGATAATDALSTPVPQDAQVISSTSQAVSPTAAVGTLFTVSDGKLSKHFCTASVVQSTHGDLIVTAAHCVTGVKGQIDFVPGYAGGKQPYGDWRVTAIYTDKSWQTSRNPADDFAFLRLANASDGVPIQNITGAERLGISWQMPALVRVIGYPDSAGRPIACTNWARKFSSTQLVFDCAGYTDGTSGSPFLTDVYPSSQQGTVIGVIGGYEQGGDKADVSYAAAFGAGAYDLYRTAEASS